MNNTHNSSGGHHMEATTWMAPPPTNSPPQKWYKGTPLQLTVADPCSTFLAEHIQMRWPDFHGEDKLAVGPTSEGDAKGGSVNTQGLRGGSHLN